MSCAQCQGILQEFDASVAQRELRRYRRRGARGTTLMLLDLLRGEGVRDRTFLDVGGGVGVLQHELMAAGASAGTDVDASPAYLSVCREEAVRLGYAERMRYVHGDFIALADTLEPADIVTLDRVLCCYPDMPGMVDASASRARRIYGVVIPREHWLMRLGIRLINIVQRLRRRPFRVFLHHARDVDARVLAHGLDRRYHGHSLLWQVLLYTRQNPDTQRQPTIPLTPGDTAR